MKPLRIRIDRIIDFGAVVSLVGIDLVTAMPVSIHVDHRPFSAVRKALREAGLPRPVEYKASGLLLHLDMLPHEAADQVRLVECGGANPANANDNRLAAREIEP